MTEEARLQILEQIAGIITGDDQRAMEEVRLCTREPQVYQQQYCGRYRERGIDLPDAAGNDLQWLGVADILIEHGYAAERDWKDEKEDFIYFLSQLRPFAALGLSIQEDELDEDDGIDAWCEILARQWSAEKVRVADFGIDSDSYVLFLAGEEQLSALQKLAKQIGQWIT
ncbi:hypothetical protein C814_00632 [Anaerotruncus sp. G3(2012)]|uniref:DUF6630 family protein n=1 Tax=Anaerotruncus sp. G3(2012) TaxID=1235835 RepID=UPI00033F02A1|nr:DUF6630 family protein [Anaerotruncus sp. G3(2012)]EOS63898.1 hypothetical protein C814_00632 [Anaerotruncus sp. G3(2012)]